MLTMHNAGPLLVLCIVTLYARWNVSQSVTLAKSLCSKAKTRRYCIFTWYLHPWENRSPAPNHCFSVAPHPEHLIGPQTWPALQPALLPWHAPASLPCVSPTKQVPSRHQDMWQSGPFSSTSPCPTDSCRNGAIPPEYTGIHRNGTRIHRNGTRIHRNGTGIHRNGTGIHWNGQESTGMD